MEGFIESLLAEVDETEKRFAIEDTNLFESCGKKLNQDNYELDMVENLDEDDIDLDLDEDIDTDLNLDLVEDDDIDLNLDEDDDIDVLNLDEDDDIDLDLDEDIDTDLNLDLDEDDDIDLDLDEDDLNEALFSKERRLNRLTKKADKSNRKFLKASANKNRSKIGKF